MSDSSQPRRLQPTRLLHPWDFPGKSTGVGYHCLPRFSMLGTFKLKPQLKLSMAGEGNGTPHQYSCLENPMDGGAWWAIVHGVSKSQTRPSDFTLTFHFHALEKEMATHSGVLAWRIPGTEEPGRLPYLGSHRV